MQLHRSERKELNRRKEGKTMKKVRMILLIMSIAVILFGTVGLIVVSNRQIDRTMLNRAKDYRDMWQQVLWAADGKCSIDENEREKWPMIDQMVWEATVYPETRKRIENDYLPDAEAELDIARNSYHEDMSVRQTGTDNGIIIIIAGAMLFVIWIIWTRRIAKKTQNKVAS